MLETGLLYNGPHCCDSIAHCINFDQLLPSPPPGRRLEWAAHAARGAGVQHRHHPALQFLVLEVARHPARRAASRARVEHAWAAQELVPDLLAALPQGEAVAARPHLARRSEPGQVHDGVDRFRAIAAARAVAAAALQAHSLHGFSFGVGPEAQGQLARVSRRAGRDGISHGLRLGFHHIWVHNCLETPSARPGAFWAADSDLDVELGDRVHPAGEPPSQGRSVLDPPWRAAVEASVEAPRALQGCFPLLQIGPLREVRHVAAAFAQQVHDARGPSPVN
eukprot:2154345-Alexandrium_andersonii.AAC.1